MVTESFNQFYKAVENQILFSGFANSALTSLTTPQSINTVTKPVAASDIAKDFYHMTSESIECSTEIEHKLASLWQQVLNTDFLPRPSDDFFSLGGDSVAMIMTELRIKEEFSVDLPEGAMLSVSSLRELSQLIEQRR